MPPDEGVAQGASLAAAGEDEEGQRAARDEQHDAAGLGRLDSSFVGQVSYGSPGDIRRKQVVNVTGRVHRVVGRVVVGVAPE